MPYGLSRPRSSNSSNALSLHVQRVGSVRILEMWLSLREGTSEGFVSGRTKGCTNATGSGYDNIIILLSSISC